MDGKDMQLSHTYFTRSFNLFVFNEVMKMFLK